jgi:hypothetical protein
MVAQDCNPSYLEAEIGRISVQGQPGQIVPETPSPKTTRAKWTGGVAQAVEHLPLQVRSPVFKPQF